MLKLGCGLFRGYWSVDEGVHGCGWFRGPWALEEEIDGRNVLLIGNYQGTGCGDGNTKGYVPDYDGAGWGVGQRKAGSQRKDEVWRKL